VTKTDISEFMKPKGCPMSRLALSEEQRAKLETALAMPNEVVSNASVRRVLKDWGFSIGRDCISSHRKKECNCA
jgi:hypothetical protein